MSKLEEFKQLLSGGVSENMCLFCCSGDDRNIIIGGTREQSFKVGFTTNIIKSILITYTQHNKVIIRKDLSDVKIIDRANNALIHYVLSEEETIKFDPSINAYVQLKVILKDNSVIESEIYELDIINELTKEQLKLRENQYCYALDVNVIEQNINVVSVYPLIAGSNNIYKCKFKFDASWNVINDIKVIFKDQYHAKIDGLHLINGECVIPKEALEKPGIINISIIGSGEGYFKPTLWSNSIHVYSGGE